MASSAPYLVQGTWASGEVYLAGGRLGPAESLTFVARSPEGFGWGNVGEGAAQLALALLLCATEHETALEHYKAFQWEIIARLPRRADFELPVAAVHDWIASRTEPRPLRR